MGFYDRLGIFLVANIPTIFLQRHHITLVCSFVEEEVLEEPFQVKVTSTVGLWSLPCESPGIPMAREGEQNLLPQNMHLWHKDYLELVIF